MTFRQLTISDQIIQLSSQIRRSGEVHMVNLQWGLLYLSMSQQKWTHPFVSMLQDVLARVIVCMHEPDVHPKTMILHEFRCTMDQARDRRGAVGDHLHGVDTCFCHHTSETMKVEKHMLKGWNLVKHMLYNFIVFWHDGRSTNQI